MGIIREGRRGRGRKGREWRKIYGLFVLKYRRKHDCPWGDSDLSYCKCKFWTPLCGELGLRPCDMKQEWLLLWTHGLLGLGATLEIIYFNFPPLQEDLSFLPHEPLTQPEASIFLTGSCFRFVGCLILRRHFHLLSQNQIPWTSNIDPGSNLQCFKDLI